MLDLYAVYVTPESKFMGGEVISVCDDLQEAGREVTFRQQSSDFEGCSFEIYRMKSVEEEPESKFLEENFKESTFDDIRKGDMLRVTMDKDGSCLTFYADAIETINGERIWFSHSERAYVGRTDKCLIEIYRDPMKMEWGTKVEITEGRYEGATVIWVPQGTLPRWLLKETSTFIYGPLRNWRVL